MKLFIAKYGWTSSGNEKSVILADDKKEAMKFVTKLQKDAVLVDGKPRDYGESGHKELEYNLEEIEFKKGIIYTGQYCC